MKIIAALLLGLALITSNAFAAVNVNTATQEELESLNGIGPVKAKAILDYRKQHGPFKSVGELDNVPGIGPATMEKIRGDVTLTGPTTVQEKAKPSEKVETKKTEPAKPATPTTKAESAKPATAATAAKADTAQQDKMKDCNAQAGKKDLKGGDRKKFMKSCLSAKPDKKAEKEEAKADKKEKKADKKETKAEAKEEKKLTPRQQKMKDCNEQAGDKKLEGDAHKKFMKTCLSAK